MIISIGADLSLVASGVTVLLDNTLVEKKLIKSKPTGDSIIKELERLLTIVNQVMDIVDKHKVKNKTVVCIEGMAFMARNTRALCQLAALNYLLRSLLYTNNIQFIIIAPTSLKKFICGKGNSKKDEMLLEVYKRYGISFSDDNLCDAFGLAQIGLALLNGNEKTLNNKQEEVIGLLKKQL